MGERLTWDMELCQQGGAWAPRGDQQELVEEDEMHWSSGCSPERKSGRGHRKGGWKAGRLASCSCLGATLLWPCRYIIRSSHRARDIDSARSNEGGPKAEAVMSSHALKGRGDFYSSHVVFMVG